MRASAFGVNRWVVVRAAILLALCLLPASFAAAQEADLLDALLASDDLPEGWAREGINVSTEPRELDSRMCDEGEPSSTFTVLRGAAVEYKRDTRQRVTTISHSVSVFAPGDAQRWLACLCQARRDCTEERRVEDDEGPLVRSAPLAFPALGDQTVAVRSELGAAEAPVIVTELVIVRRGDALFALRHRDDLFGSGRAEVDTVLTEQLARRADALLASLTEGR